MSNIICMLSILEISSSMTKANFKYGSDQSMINDVTDSLHRFHCIDHNVLIHALRRSLRAAIKDCSGHIFKRLSLFSRLDKVDIAREEIHAQTQNNAE